MKTKFQDLAGKIYNRWTVNSYAGTNKGGQAIWNCTCTCNVNKTVVGTNLIRGMSKSCGCLNKEIITRHGMCNTPEYDTWVAIRWRCTKPSSDVYEYYGGRGITVCDRWMKSFSNFIEDMGKKPGKAFSLDRIDNNGNYEPSNCRWATKKEQSYNRRSPYKNSFVDSLKHELALYKAKFGELNAS